MALETKPDSGETAKARNDRIIALAKQRYKTINEAEVHIRDSALEDIKFVYDVDEGQWPADIRAAREADNRPCLTSNKLRKFVSTVANQERENRVAIQVRPIDDISDPETAQVYEDLVRQIEHTSNADQVYADTGEQAAAGGFGYFRIYTHLPQDSFDQEIVIEGIENQFSVHMDPRKQYCFISDWMRKDEFEHLWPKAEEVNFNYQDIGEEWSGWYEKDRVHVAEYFAIEPVERKLLQVKNKQTGELGVIELRGSLTEDDVIKQGFEIIQRRTSDGTQVKWYKITGSEILEERDIPCSQIPVIEVLGDKVNVSGREYKRSLIRDGKDPQRMYNYWLTTETETVALAPKAPYILSAKEISGHEKMWDEANKKNLPYLLFNPQGNRVPQRNAPPQVSPGHASMMQVANQDIKDTLGLFESFIGEQSNERSGRAIGMRTQRGQVATLHFPDNLRRSIITAGQILIEMIPRIYDTERVIRVRGEDGKERPLRINYTVRDEKTGDVHLVNDMSRGKYDVIADVRQYATRRQESVETLLQAMQYAPGVAPYILDLLFKFMDAPGANEVEDRIKQFLASQTQEQNNGNNQGKSGTGGPGGPVPPAGQITRLRA